MNNSTKTSSIEFSLFMIVYIIWYPVFAFLFNDMARPLWSAVGLLAIIPGIILNNVGSMLAFYKGPGGATNADVMIIAYVALFIRFAIYLAFCMAVRGKLGMIVLKK